jgi:hypothetical protein
LEGKEFKIMEGIKLIGIFLIVTGGVGVILGALLVFDVIGIVGDETSIAAFIGAIPAILSGVGFLMVDKKLA